MKKPGISLLTAAIAGVGLLTLSAPAQQDEPNIKITLTQGERPVIAVPDFRGAGEAQTYMDDFNRTLFADLQESGYFTMAAKSMYPLQVPQRPEEFKAPAEPTTPARRGQPPPAPVSQGPWLTDWSNPPVNANYLTVGYTAVQNGRIVLFGWLYNVKQTDISNAQIFGKLYFGTVDAAGARKVAHEFAGDILEKFGAKSLAGTKIFFTRIMSPGVKEIWSMDPDGANQKQLTHLGSITNFAAVSPDGTRLAFMTYAKAFPSIMVLSTDSGRYLPFFNQPASMNSDPTFTPDGKQIVFSSTAAGGAPQLYSANLDGSGLRRITYGNAIDAEPEVNPRTGEIVLTSGRSGPPQVYKINMDGANAVRLTTGEGDAVNPSWHPDGQHIAFAWTKGYDPGNYNIFIMDVTTREPVQLTHGQGRNENPYWAPDGNHIVFSSNRSGSIQIWTMLADGTQLRQLTTQGVNEKPIWTK